MDGSRHWWFETRGPQCTLLVYIDDATSRLMHLQFVETESTFDYFEATRAYLERYGKPIAFYSDKHAVFRVNKKDAAGGDGMWRGSAATRASQARHLASELAVIAFFQRIEEIRGDILARCVNWQLAKRRAAKQTNTDLKQQ